MSEKTGSYTTRRFSSPIDDLLDRPIAFNPAFKRITGSTVAALFLSQAWYWTKRTSDETGWFYKTQAEWEEETGLTRTEQDTARRHLRDQGILEEDLRGIPARMYYRLNKDVFYNLFTDFPQTSLQEPYKLDSGIPTNINRNSETTAGNTTETTTGKQRKNQISIPPGSDPAFAIAAGLSNEEIVAAAEKATKESDRAVFYEAAMGYNSLNWWNDRDLKKLLDFLMTKTLGEINTFAAWSKKEFSPLSPTQARKNPKLVIDLWPQAFSAAGPANHSVRPVHPAPRMVDP